MSRWSPGAFPRREFDDYGTKDDRAVAAIIPFLHRDQVTEFIEPCRGDGDLARSLEAAGFRCAHASDVREGRNALMLGASHLPLITNPPYEWPVLRPLLEHFFKIAPFCWLLLPLPWVAAKRVAGFMRHCTDIVIVGRLRWFPGSPHTSLDDFCWYRFDHRHTAGPILHPRGSVPTTRTARCEECDEPYAVLRSSAQTCSHRCRQRAYRGRLP
jgi:hypothetical protein